MSAISSSVRKIRRAPSTPPSSPRRRRTLETTVVKSVVVPEVVVDGTGRVYVVGHHRRRLPRDCVSSSSGFGGAGCGSSCHGSFAGFGTSITGTGGAGVTTGAGGSVGGWLTDFGLRVRILSGESTRSPAFTRAKVVFHFAASG